MPSQILPLHVAAGPSHTLDDLIRSTLDFARNSLGMEVGFVTEIRNGQRYFRHVSTDAAFRPFDEGLVSPLPQTYCEYILNGAMACIVPDIAHHPDMTISASTAAMGIRAHVGVPITLSDGSTFGTFCCYSRTPQPQLAQVEVALMAQFATLIGQMLEERVVEERAQQRILTRLAKVIEDSRVDIVYQPIVRLRDRTVAGYEALARFNDEPLRAPDIWFNEAHDAGQGALLELLALEKSLMQLDAIGRHAYLAMNVSPQTILSPGFSALLAQFPLNRLVLEVTEHALIDDYASLAAILAPMRANGLRLAVDDAGSGYASMRHILVLKPDLIKLDISLIRNIDRDPGQRALAAALILFADQTGSEVVAEGVESERELAVLLELGVSKAQGYLLGYPGALAG
jgi:EAL domain-containing protein (putative c-di-GMP-specific phosphodiesterase class I)